MSATPSVLYDAPGPRARRLSLVTSIVLGVVITIALRYAPKGLIPEVVRREAPR